MDSITFKNEYEKLNSNSNFIKVNIPSDNPIIYVNELELIEKLNSNEDMIVFFGYSNNNKVRNIVENLIDACSELKIDKVYYLDISSIRDEIVINDDEEVISNEGTEGYNKLLEILSDYVDDYIVDGKIVGKRIYAPYILFKKNNTIERFIYEDNQEDLDKKILEYLKKYTNNSCDVNEGC